MCDIKYFVIDVDGTLTDSGIYYDDNGNEIKKFSTRDAAGFFVSKKLGLKTIVITGRKCLATEKRLSELQVDYLYQDIKNKEILLRDIMVRENISKDVLGYIGDDLNDLEAMKLAGFVACPSDSCYEVKQLATYISPVCGGKGVFRDVIEFLYRPSGKWEQAMNLLYSSCGK